MSIEQFFVNVPLGFDSWIDVDGGSKLSKFCGLQLGWDCVFKKMR